MPEQDTSAEMVRLHDVKDDDETDYADATPPSVQGEQSVSGDMPDPESDDNMLDNMHEFGVALDADEDTPKELDIAGDVAAAERRRRGM